MRLSVICPVKNEVDFIGYSIMSVLPYVHNLCYGVAHSTDGTLELLQHIKAKYAGDKLQIFTDMGSEVELPQIWDFNPMDQAAYNYAFDYLILASQADACWFLHPDMIVTNPERLLSLKDGPLAWTCNVTSYAGDFQTQITKGRATQWKNIHANKFGLHYFGGYGSVNEDFYHREITGNSYRHYGTAIEKYPYEVANSGIEINHYCELKGYKRRLEKMKLCLKTQNPTFTDVLIEELAVQHPRVTLEPGTLQFGHFEFQKTDRPIPDVFHKYKDEFESFKKEKVLIHG